MTIFTIIKLNQHYMKTKTLQKITFIFLIFTLIPVSLKAQTNTYYIQNKSSQKYLDVPGSSKKEGEQIIQWEFHGGINQKWTFIPSKDGLYFIKSECSGKYLEVPNSLGKDGINIVQNEFQGGENQKWNLVLNPDKSYYIISKVTGKYLDNLSDNKENGSKIIQWTGHGNGNQRWFLKTATIVNNSEAPYKETQNQTNPNDYSLAKGITTYNISKTKECNETQDLYYNYSGEYTCKQSVPSSTKITINIHLNDPMYNEALITVTNLKTKEVDKFEIEHIEEGENGELLFNFTIINQPHQFILNKTKKTICWYSEWGHWQKYYYYN
jgi:hypothetical protein